MNLLGLNADERLAYHEGMCQPHSMRARLVIRDRNEAVISEALNTAVRITEGSVQVDADQDVTRVLTMHIVDPHRTFYLDPASPSPNALSMDRFLQVIREDYITALSRWVPCSVFWGPVTKLDQTGFSIGIEAMGKEYLYLDPNFMWTARTFPAGGPLVTGLIHWILAQRGETKFVLPAIQNKIRRDITITPMTAGWPLVKTLADNVGYQAFYDGEGYFRMRKVPTDSVYTFRKGWNVIDDPAQPLDFTDFANLHEQAWTRSPPEIARLPSSDPASPESLSRNGVPRYMVRRSESTVIDTKEEAHVAAVAGLTAAARLGEGASFDALPIPHLEEADIVSLETPEFQVSFSLRQFTIPLTPVDIMPIGYLRRSRLQKRVVM